jgi:lysine/ornithine N-monooxygenase
MSNGEIMTKVKRMQLEITVSDDQESLRIIETDQVVMFRSRVLVVANGGRQSLHPELFNWFPNLNPRKVVASDEFLRSDVFQGSIATLNKKQTKKIVIIGGSHSGFSCAWMLLNGPAAYYRNNANILVEKEP